MITKDWQRVIVVKDYVLIEYYSALMPDIPVAISKINPN